MRTSTGRLLATGMLEGLSFLLLLCVAMPLKYIWDKPEAVSIVGMAHGVLFVLFVFLVLHAWGEKRISARQAGLALLASVVPFGPFFLDRQLAGGKTGEGQS